MSNPNFVTAEQIETGDAGEISRFEFGGRAFIFLRYRPDRVQSVYAVISAEGHVERILGVTSIRCASIPKFITALQKAQAST